MSVLTKPAPQGLLLRALVIILPAILWRSPESMWSSEVAIPMKNHTYCHSPWNKHATVSTCTPSVPCPHKMFRGLDQTNTQQYPAANGSQAFISNMPMQCSMFTRKLSSVWHSEEGRHMFPPS
eukprot:1158742-Pelagomonas_calceolata.AAC.4